MTAIAIFVTCIYLLLSCVLGIIALAMIEINPEGFDEYRSNDPWERLSHVGSVMILGPVVVPLSLMAGSEDDR